MKRGMKKKKKKKGSTKVKNSPVKPKKLTKLTLKKSYLQESLCVDVIIHILGYFVTFSNKTKKKKKPAKSDKSQEEGVVLSRSSALIRKFFGKFPHDSRPLFLFPFIDVIKLCPLRKDHVLIAPLLEDPTLVFPLFRKKETTSKEQKKKNKRRKVPLIEYGEDDRNTLFFTDILRVLEKRSLLITKVVAEDREIDERGCIEIVKHCINLQSAHFGIFEVDRSIRCCYGLTKKVGEAIGEHPKLKHLSWKGVDILEKGLEGVSLSKTITSLEFCGSVKFAHFVHVGDMKQLESFIYVQHWIRHQLYTYQDHVVDHDSAKQLMKKFSSLENFKCLSIQGVKELGNALEGLVGNTSLVRIELSNCDFGDALSVIGGLTNLVHLNLQDSQEFKGLQNLSGLQNLEFINVNGAGEGFGNKGIKLISRLPNLKVVHLRSADITKIIPLCQCKKLEELDLGINSISDAGLKTVLKKCKSLKKVVLQKGRKTSHPTISLNYWLDLLKDKRVFITY